MTTQPLSALTMLLSRHTKRREFINLVGGAAARGTRAAELDAGNRGALQWPRSRRYPVRTGPEFDRAVTLMQRTMCSWPSHTSGGTAVVQAGWTYRHRAAKAQPGGRAARLGGAPGIASRRRPRMAPCTVEASRPLV